MTTESAATPSALPPSRELTIFEAAEFKQALVSALVIREPLTLDLSRVARMDTSGVQLIIAARRAGRVTVVGLSQGLQQMVAAIGGQGLLAQ